MIGYSPFGGNRPITGPVRQIQGGLLMNVSLTQPNQHTCVIGFSGKLDFQSRHAFQSATVQAEQASTRQIILDFTDLSHIDSAGLSLLSLAHKKLSAMGSRMVIANAREISCEIFFY